MTARDYVLRVHPNSTCKQVVGDKRQWRVYYTWMGKNGTRMHQLLGYGTSSRDAWKTSWETIQLTMLRKLEGNSD